MLTYIPIAPPVPKPSYLAPTYGLKRLPGGMFWYNGDIYKVDIVNRRLLDRTVSTLYVSTITNYNNYADDYVRIEKAARVYSRRFLKKGVHTYIIVTEGRSKCFAASNINDLINNIRKKEAEKYQPGDFVVDRISVGYGIDKRYEPILSDKSLLAKGSDKCVEKLGDYYIATLSSVKDKCVAQAKITWDAYISAKDNILCNDKIIKDMTKSSDISTIMDYGVEPLILFDREQIKMLDPKITTSNIVLYYKREHVSLVMHKTFLSSNASAYLNLLAKPGFTSVMRPLRTKKPISDIINTMDLECERKYNKTLNIIEHIPIASSYILNNVRYQSIGYSCIEETFNNIDKYLDNNSIIWLHNGGKYDIHIILEHINKLINTNREQPIEVVDSNQVIIELRLILRSNKTIILRDSRAIISGSLKDLSKSFKIINPKKEDVDSRSLTLESFNNDKVKEYAIQDAVALQQILAAYRDLLLRKKFPNPLQFCTITSICKYMFYTSFYQHCDSYITELNLQAHDYIRRSYHGGIVKAFITGIFNNINSYDIHSSFPAAGTNKIPCGTPWYSNSSYLINKRSDIPAEQCFIRCKVIVGKNSYSIPIHLYYDNDNKEIPEDQCSLYDQIIYCKEIELGLEYGYKYHMLDYISFTDSKPILANIFRSLYANKLKAEKKGDAVKRLIYKLYSNSFYGFFGFNKYNKDVVRIYSNNDINRTRCENIVATGDGMYTEKDKILYCVQKQDIPIKGTNVAIASAITSYARIQLFRLGKYIEDKGYKIYYCDTDSIKTNMPNTPNHELFGVELGQADLEHKDEEVIECCIYKKKLMTTIFRNINTGVIRPHIVSKGLNFKSHYISDVDIIDLDDKDKLSIIQQLKTSYLNNTNISTIQGNIRTSRTNPINNLPYLYEKTYNKIIL